MAAELVRSRSGLSACVLLGFLLAGTRQSFAQSPFVAGFERFARHGEIDQSLAGQLLLTELSCTACHMAPPGLQPKRGPNLTGVGNRVHREWLIRFLADPQKAKPGTTMPSLLSGLDNPEQAGKALVAYLMTQRKTFPEIKGTGARPVPHEFWNRGQRERGRRLYHRVGCVACHEPDESYETVATKPGPLDQLLKVLEPEELKELGLSSAARRVESVPQGDLAEKYSRQSLTYFLLDPHQVRPGGRMPNFQLTVDEASDLTAWLLRGQIKRPQTADSKPDPDLVAQGQRLFRELRCVNCHTIPGIEPTQFARPTSQLDRKSPRSCIGKPESGLPHFPLDAKQQAAIMAGVKGTGLDTFATPLDLAGQVQQQMLRLNCFACHERDQLGGIGRYRKAFFETYGHVDIGDEGRLPPPLTNVGRKLQPAWTTKVLQGTGRLRPHMRIRMPVFPDEQVGQLPSVLTQLDSRENRKPLAEESVFGQLAGLAPAGRLLLDTGCVQCHPLRGEALPGVVGIDLAGITTRVQPQWFHDFLLNPADLKPRTRMPTFFPNGRSQNAKILDGDTERQIAAMWAYLKDLSRQKLPPKIEKARSQNYELIPGDRPILLRTFMEEAGTHAVAVGFPQRVHFAFDAEEIRPAFAWRGRFLDARGTWFERFTPPAAPLGDGIPLPAGVALALPGNPDGNPDGPWPSATGSRDYRYRGHRLDRSGVPTFRYSLGEFSVEDRVTPGKESGLRRVLTISHAENSAARTLRFLAHSGTGLKHSGRSCTDAKGLKVIVKSESLDRGRIVGLESHSEWRIPVHIEGRTEIEVHYEW